MKDAETTTALKYLDLSDNDITDDGAAALAKMLSTNSVLRTLDLSKNDIGSYGVEKLAEALQMNGMIIEINLDFNPDIVYDDSMKAIRRSLDENQASNQTTCTPTRPFR